MYEGLPLVILMVGSELMTEEGEIEPKEMVEFLTECRLHALSRENYPEEDRVGKFMRLILPVTYHANILGFQLPVSTVSVLPN